MRQITATLAAAPKQASRQPCVRGRAVNKHGGIVKQNWSRLYTGTETAYYHAVTAPGDGSLVRARITPLADSRKLYRQRVASPGSGSDFSSWTYTGQSEIVAVTCASCGPEVSIIWVKYNREIRRIRSADYGVSWTSPELLDYAPSTSVSGIAAAYKPNGDLAIFITDQSVLAVKKRTGGQWQSFTAWNKTTGNLSGVACTYDGDWCLLVTGVDTAGNYKLWSLVYGDGGDVTAETWSALKEMAAAPSGGDFSYKCPFLDKTDVVRCFFIESFSGIPSGSHPYRSYIIPGTRYCDGLWREPEPFNLSSVYGLSLTHTAGNAWMSAPDGVWRASSDLQTLDISPDITGVREELGETEGNLVVELRNDDGRYSFTGQGNLEALTVGSQLELDPGYITSQGAEYSAGQSFTISGLEHVHSNDRAGLAIYAADAWRSLENWTARHQFRWNKTSDEYSLKDILAVILARAGIKLTVITNSTALTGFYPDFTVNPGNTGKEIVLKLLGYVPDKLFMEGDTAYVINPQSSDNPVYSYGTGHDIQEGWYRHGPMPANHFQVEGWDTGQGRAIIVDSYDWNVLSFLGEHFRHIRDGNLNTVTETGQRGTALLRQAEMEAEKGTIIVPVNCAHQLYDVVAVTDIAAGLGEAAKRITGIKLMFRPGRGEYIQYLGLGKV